eukprot:3607706-Rhodomonas_salina.3
MHLGWVVRSGRCSLCLASPSPRHSSCHPPCHSPALAPTPFLNNLPGNPTATQLPTAHTHGTQPHPDMGPARPGQLGVGHNAHRAPPRTARRGHEALKRRRLRLLPYPRVTCRVTSLRALLTPVVFQQCPLRVHVPSLVGHVPPLVLLVLTRVPLERGLVHRGLEQHRGEALDQLPPPL